jgi:hypothetical protein
MFDDNDHYGFFCDIENAKTMEYEKFEYYIVMTRPYMKVIRKLSGSNAYQYDSTNHGKKNDLPLPFTDNIAPISETEYSCFQTEIYAFIVFAITISCTYFIVY